MTVISIRIRFNSNNNSCREGGKYLEMVASLKEQLQDRSAKKNNRR